MSGSEQKVNEYVERIRGGENKESVTQGLPAFFRDAIEKRLLLEQDRKSEQKEIAIIPPQYSGLDSESLDFIWDIPEYLDPEKTKEEKDRKQRAISYLKRQEEENKQKENQRKEDQKKIEKIREELNLPKKEKPNFGNDEQLEGIYDTMQNIAGGAKDGLRDDFERKVQKYVDEINSGKDKEYVLQGIPEKWRKIVEEKLAGGNSSTEKESKKDFDSLSVSEIESFMKSLPKIPVAEGSRMTIIDPNLLQSKTIRSLHVGDNIYTLYDKYVIAEVLPATAGQNDIGQVNLRLSDGRRVTTNVLMDTYLLEDIRKIYEKI